MLPTDSGSALRAHAAHQIGPLSLILMDETCFMQLTDAEGNRK